MSQVMIYFELLMITSIIVFIIDLSGVMTSIKGLLSRWIHRPVARLKPLDCSLCSTFWIGLIYSIIQDQFSLPVLCFVCLMAYFTTIIKGLLEFASDCVIILLNKILNRLQ